MQEKTCIFVDFSSIFATVLSTWKQTFAGGNTLELLCALWTLSTMIKSITLDDIKTVITGIKKSNIRPDCKYDTSIFQGETRN